MLETPVALFIFNRPELTRGLLDCVRPVRPRRLFVVADAARDDRAGEIDKVAETRAVIDQIDWTCDVTRIYADQNMGCGARIHSGISEAFDAVEELIILEDDCRPDPTFFSFVESMLRRYREDSRVMAVSGNCFHDLVPTESSYYFSRYAHCWGWGTWRHAWSLYDDTVRDWPAIAASRHYAEMFRGKHEAAYWTHLFDRIAQGKLDTWDIQWLLTCWMNSGLTVLPTKNLVQNVGFGDDATHTKTESVANRLPIHSMEQIIHPTAVRPDWAADVESDRLLFSGTWRSPNVAKLALNRLRRHTTARRNLAPRYQTRTAACATTRTAA